VRRELVLDAVAGEKGHPPTPDLADGHRGGRLPVRGLDVELVDAFEERVEAGSAEDADLGGTQADFPLLSPPVADFDSLPEEPEEPDEPPDPELEVVEAAGFDDEVEPSPSDDRPLRLSVR